MGIKFQKVSSDVNTDTSTWQIRLHGTSDAEVLEQSLVKKQDWAGIKVFHYIYLLFIILFIINCYYIIGMCWFSQSQIAPLDRTRKSSRW
jgi:hypothetical protein